MWEYKYFTEKEMRCKCGCGGLPKPELMEKLDRLREMYGRPIRVTSGFRCKSYNTKIGGAPTSRHTTGEAVDISANSADKYSLIQLGYLLGFGGIGVDKVFLHLDIRPTEEGRVWVY